MKKIYIYIAVAVVLIVVGYFAFKWYKNKKVKEAETGNELPAELPVQSYQSQTTTQQATPQAQTNDFPMKKGSKGAKVKELQNALNIRYKTGLSVDGVWGYKTEASLRKLYKKNTPISLSESAWYDIVYKTGAPSKPATASNNVAVELWDLGSKV